MATGQDRDAVRAVHMLAFPESENQVVAALAVNLLDEETQPETLSLVAETDGAVVGHVAFSPVFASGTQDWIGHILAPLGVMPDYQHRKIGSALVENGMQRVSALGAGIVFVYGDPGYYGRFGFDAGLASGYSPPYALQYPFGWQAIALDERAIADRPVNIDCVAALSDPGLW